MSLRIGDIVITTKSDTHKRVAELFPLVLEWYDETGRQTETVPESATRIISHQTTKQWSEMKLISEGKRGYND